jgi:uridylate kinase
VNPKYRRILLKMSGEILGGRGESGIDLQRVGELAAELAPLHQAGVGLALVVGGGNIFRGARGTLAGLDRVAGDHMGMLATVINSLAVQDVLERSGIPTRVMTAVRVDAVAEPFIRRRALRHLEKGRVLILAGGTGNPYFTTDTAGALRAVEIGAEVLFKGTKVDGVYDADPATHPGARRFERLTYDEVLNRDLKVMDAAAIALARDNALPIVVFDVNRNGDLQRAVCGETVGTWVGKG